MAAMTHPSRSSALSVGLVGGGRVGVHFAKFLKSIPEVRLAGFVTSTPARQQELSQQFGVPAYGSVEQMMDAKDRPAMVAVVNANDDHAKATIAALNAGAHVFCEKPMAPTMAECKAMVDAERKSGKVLQIGFEYMHGTMTSRLRQLVRDGFFGDLTWASVLDSRGHWWSDDPSVDRSTIWKLDRARGGGICFHCGIHQLDMIRTYLGPIDEITAFRPSKNALHFYPADVPDNVTLMLRAHGGAVCNFQIFHNRAPTFYREGGFHPDWRQVPGHDFDISLVGTKGSCEMKIYKEKLYLFKFDHDRRDTTLERIEDFAFHPADKSHHDMNGLLRQFVHNLLNGKGAVDPSSEALETMELAFAAEDAIARGGTVKLADYR